MTPKRKNRNQYIKDFKQITIYNICKKLKISTPNVYTDRIGEEKLQMIKTELLNELKEFIDKYE